MFNQPHVFVLSLCPQPPPRAGIVCVPFDEAMRLHAVKGRLVVVEVPGPNPGQRYTFDLDDVCLHGARSESGACWCIPIEKALSA
jgi:hypothetical protein